MTLREVEAILQRAGFELDRQTGHRIWYRGTVRVSLPTHRGDVKTGTLRAIIREAGMTVQEFRQYR